MQLKMIIRYWTKQSPNSVFAVCTFGAHSKNPSGTSHTRKTLGGIAFGGIGK